MRKETKSSDKWKEKTNTSDKMLENICNKLSKI